MLRHILEAGQSSIMRAVAHVATSQQKFIQVHPELAHHHQTSLMYEMSELAKSEERRRRIEDAVELSAMLAYQSLSVTPKKSVDGKRDAASKSLRILRSMLAFQEHHQWCGKGS